MKPLVLSLFPGIDLLGYAFKREGFSVVRGGDVISGEDIRDEHYPPGRFDGVIGGPPCQTHSRMAHLVRATGGEPSFINLIPEFERVVSEAAPLWFVMENVPDAPDPVVDGYEVTSFLLNCRQCFGDDGEPSEQDRDRRWWFGFRGKRRVLQVETAPLFGVATSPTVLACENWKGMPIGMREKYQRQNGTKEWRRTWATQCRLQGLPETFDLPYFTAKGKGKAIGNGVPVQMGRAIARAVAEVIECPSSR